VGYKLPDGRYVDDQGRTHRNYNDAAASAKTRSARGQTEQMLSSARAIRQQANDNLWQGRVNKGLLGWIPGYSEALDQGMAANARQMQAADDAIRAREGQLGIYKARMGEGSAPPTIDRREGSESRDPRPAPGLGAPAAYGDPAQRARDSNLTAMAQQYAPQNYWQGQTGAALAEAAKTGPKAGTAGYAQRADIQAWIAANQNAPKGVDGKNIVDRFLEEQGKRGLLDAPGEAGTALAVGAERIAMPTDAASAVQAGMKGLVGYDGTALQQAQAGVAEIQGRENAALTQRIFQQAADGTLARVLPESMQPQVDMGVNWAQTAKAAITPAAGAEMEIAEPFSSPELNRQFASLGQPAAAQAVATGTGSGPTLQPTSAAAGEVGVEPSQPDAPGNKPNPADELARRYVDGLRTRTARLGY